VDLPKSAASVSKSSDGLEHFLDVLSIQVSHDKDNNFALLQQLFELVLLRLQTYELGFRERHKLLLIGLL